MSTTPTDNNDATPDKGTPDTRRVNNMPLVIGGTVAVAFLIMMVVVAIDRSATPQGAASEQTLTPDSSSTSKMEQTIVGEYGAGLIPEPKKTTPVPVSATEIEANDLPIDSPPLLLSQQPPALPRSTGNHFFNPNIAANPIDEEAQRIRDLKMQQFHQAVHAKTSVSIDTGGANSFSSGVPSRIDGGAPQNREEMLARLAAVRSQMERKRQTDPTAVYQQRMAALKASGLIPDTGISAGMDGGAALLPASGAISMDSAMGSGNDYSAFDKVTEGDRWQLNERLQLPRSAFELRAGFIIPATMISGINSDLPGQLVAQVSQNVFDTATGRYLLVPQGTRLVGSYESDVIYGQSRILIAWQRLIFPDGKALDLGSMPGADSAGYSGFNDKVNNHYLRLFGNAFLMSGITAGISLSQDKGGNTTGTNQRASDALSESLGQVLGNTISQIVSKNLNISPTLEVRPGYRFNVIVTKDLTFQRPYQAFDY
ncbi:hypothetical protein AXE65_04200 [Ventosimonas gracilis]|uniref:Conjugal transfer protein TrbI n=1 Tax=Ventosimonas gracilis TaxID=1680762 RepID=A0A139SR26_9GAMM|nr:TrbI/VirB10 family protein [Ventosimonas gracilis]KXU36987.1 hypothetical protein AXE65_04200 [Ventosimonas gracilis]